MFDGVGTSDLELDFASHLRLPESASAADSLRASPRRGTRLPGYGSSCRRGSAFPFVALVAPPKNREVDWNLTSAGSTEHGRRFVRRHRVPHQSLRARSSARECRAPCSLIGPPEDVLSPFR